MRVIITGTTGMVGKGVLLECLENPKVEHILVINRTSINLTHPKLNEILHNDFLNLQSIENQLSGYDTCFFCLGVSSFRMSEEDFTKYTYSLTISFAQILLRNNPKLTFIYVSGAGTDSSEKGKIMWARVKGKTENAVLKMFKKTYLFRPGIIIPEKGVKSKTPLYNFFYVLMKPFFPFLKKMNGITTSSKVGKAMINVVEHGYKKSYIENTDINTLALK